MMHLYYTHNYTGGNGGSHRLLVKAIAAHLGDADRAEHLVSTMQRAPLAGDTDIPGNNGKPYIPGFSPFSISHSNNTWAVLILDTDRIVSIPDGNNRDREFFRFWARREALVKSIGASVADTQIPSVLSDEVCYNGRRYMINDIRIPGETGLFAAICVNTNHFNQDRMAVQMHRLPEDQ